MTVNGIDVREEYFDNVATGVEIELDDEQTGLARPWNPDDIRVGTKQFSLRNILDLIDDRDLELAPDFQRNTVWKPRQKSRLIESIMLQIPLPAFYFAEDANGMMRVVDGLQRLSTVHSYVRGGRQAFALTDLEYLDSAEKKRFEELTPALQRRINNAQIVVHVIDPTTPPGVKYDIFKRINTGGTPLNAQEIRHCMSGERSRSFLKRCTHTPEFDRATGGHFRDHIRMDDREVVLRYCAFWLNGVDGYVREGSMDIFLEKTTSILDDPREVSEGRLEELHESFRSAMEKSYEIFGDYAFRKWPWGANARNPINRPLFETWSYVLDQYDLADLIRRKSLVVDAARDLMTRDRAYIDAITTSTGDPKKVRLRFDLASRAAQASL
ncbi:hypothetical protein FDG2_5830 [Candidatus Protofrankia californiensis]|uniref:GmrSD restriction endonucleases N-terminal domain-containing protein n=1 Tax=Candidatus Protofrankia californiensis TaxID=1839754 RepID=A0A1C3PFN5_9ACTN|nr:hypothetical protein FDG2_5830 [Candidatus Protofrankia californiensis]